MTGFEKTYYGGEPWRGAKFDPDDERNVEVVSDLQNLKKFFEARMWWKLTPADSLVTARYGYCLADIGQTYVVYVEESTTVSLDLGGGPAGTYHVSVFDPRKGTSQNLPYHIGPGPVSLTAPDTQDWIFVITKSAQ